MNPAEYAHARRVAAWCREIAGRLHLTTLQREILEQGALRHYRAKSNVDDIAPGTLRAELGIATGGTRKMHADETLRGVLQSRGVIRMSSNRFKKLALILERCEDLDTACEFDAAVSGEPELSGLDGIVSEVARYFGAVTGGDLAQAASQMPVFPSIAYRAIVLLADVNANLEEVEALVASDQTLAGHIVEAANSAIMGTSSRVNSIRQAVVRIGSEAAERVVCAAALRGLYQAPNLHALWNHSLDVAESAVRIARQSRLVDCGEAFLAGLVHDIGKLAILNLPAEVVAQRNRLTRDGCPARIVERVILGEDHTTIGARALRNWRFAENIPAAIENHHTPELYPSPLCSVLYLAECSKARNLEFTSPWRTELSQRALGIQRVDWHAADAIPTPVSGLRFAVAT